MDNFSDSAGEEPEAQVALASFGSRTGAFLADFLLVFVVVSIPANLIHLKAQPELSIFFVIWGFYGAAFMYWGEGQTLGMRRFRLHCIDQASGESPTLTQAFVRSFSAALMLAAAMIQYFGLIGPAADLLWANFDPKAQTLHDKFAKTVVVR